MKNKEMFLFTAIIYTSLLLFLGIIGSINYNSDNYHTEEKTSESIIQEDNSFTFSEGVEIYNSTKYNNQHIAFGNINYKPYLSILNTNKNEIINDYIYNGMTGNITSIEDRGLYINTTINDNNTESNLDLFLAKNSLVPFHKKQLNINYSKNTTITPKYLVIHETANTRAGADANAHYRYWSTNASANASTHFVVDSNKIYQMLELNQMAWHVGDNKGYSDITNRNSIGIEICVNSDGEYMVAREYTIDLTIQIMNELNMSIDQLKNHRDASGKFDPIIMLNNNLWDDFKAQVNLGLNN